MTSYLRVALCSHPLAVYLSISDKFYMAEHFDDTEPNGRLLTMSGKCYTTEPVDTAGVKLVQKEELLFHQPKRRQKALLLNIHGETSHFFKFPEF